LGFLGSWPFGRETPRFEGWKSLDFLGFSRPNRAFSMGYAEISLKENFSRPFAQAAAPERGTWGRGHEEDAQNYSPGKPSAISVFRQPIVARQKIATRQFSHTILTIVAILFIQCPGVRLKA
jgi:hypothetical protein